LVAALADGFQTAGGELSGCLGIGEGRSRGRVKVGERGDQKPVHVRRARIAVLVFFILLLAIGLAAYDDYGIAWDEPLRYEAGSTVFGYLASGKSVPARSTDDHGLIFELVLAGIQKLSGVHDTRDIYLQRHLASHLFFLFGVFGFFLLAQRYLQNEYLALLGAGMLVISPRIYAHSFFNTKDIPFMVVMIFGLYTFGRAFEAHNSRWFLVHGILCGLLASIRILGIMLLVFTLVFMALDYLSYRRSRRLLSLAIPYLAAFTLSLFASWPFLWSDPIRRFVVALRSLSSYPWQGKVLYFGRFYSATALPWHYALVWMTITTPIAYTSAFLLGSAWSMRDLVRNLRQIFTDPLLRYTSLFLLCFFAPLVAVIVRGSVLYDGWRHLYFIYPCFLLLAIAGIAKLIAALKGKRAIYLALTGGVLALSLASTGLFMLRAHPYQHVYFNLLVPRSEEYLRRNWERDYWGLSYREALEYILSVDSRDQINVAVNTLPGEENAKILQPGERARLSFIEEPEGSDYFITDYRWHPEDYDFGSEVFSIQVQGSRIASVFQLGD
jgi:hypothetical protein